jgi:hypothetical protein
MPVEITVGKGAPIRLSPTTSWQTAKLPDGIEPEAVRVIRDRYYCEERIGTMYQLPKR